MVGVKINELPKFLAEDIDENTHAIIFNDLLNPNKPPIIPLLLNRITSYLPYREPRESEYDDESIPHIDMMSEPPVWEPSEASFTEK